MGEATVHEPGDGAAPPVIDFARLTVDIDAMSDFIKLLQAEIDQNLAPYSNEIINDHWRGQPIAREAASVPLAAFRTDYYLAVDTAVQGLRSYLDSTKVLLRAVQLLAEHYRGADSMAVASLNDVKGAMSIAQKQVKAESILETPV
jgi:hypothetical protein